uniref:Tetratricopeptide repeat protein 37 n=1 Tax=Scylla olivacea TaxID=85551 RepID=A0A0P4WDX8_SCYOL
MSEVRNALKEAKKAMKDNDFEAVSKYCKIALKHDRKNYNALLFFGRACQELGKYEDSKKALMMATQIEPDSPVAWQGLAVLCEKQPHVSTKDEYIIIYTRLIDFVKDDEEKVDSTFRKLAKLHLDNDDPMGAAGILRTLVDRLTGEKRITEAWRSLAQTLTAVTNLPKEDIPKLQEALEHSLNDSVLGENETNYQNYLRLLYRTGQRTKLVLAAQNMAKIFPTYLPLEWICRIFVELNAYPCEEQEFPLSQEETSVYITRLLSINKTSPWGNLAQGMIYSQEGRLVEAKAHLRLGADNVKNNLIGWELLRSIQEESSDWPGVETSCRKSLAILSSDNTPTIPRGEDPQAYGTQLRLMQARALVHMGHKNHLKQAVTMLEEFYKTDIDCGLLLVRSRIKLLEFDIASEVLKELEDIFGSSYQLKFLSATLLHAEGEKQQAKQLLEEIVMEEPGFAEGHLELGQIYFETGEMKHAQICCMRAGKLNPKLARAFLYLGHFFRHEDNMDKALKCYEKALSLSPSDDDVGAALSDLYRILGKYEANIQLLQRVTREGGRASCGWAWLRLGLHHLALQNHDPAIQAFQCALTINPDDGPSYECLGDAYLARGAHTAALKVFTYASQLNVTAVYPRYQIAHIKQIVGENLQSVEDFEAVLKWEPMRPVRVVSLVGLAEALLASARKHQEQFFMSNVKDACTQAIFCLIRAASMKPDCSCIWKLMGDACLMLYPMPPSLAPFTLPAKLINREIQDLDEVVEVTKLQVLQMGTRCYGLALQGTPEDALLWHDLGLSTYLQARVQEGSSEGSKEEATIRDLLSHSIQALKKGLTLDPSSSKMWSSLGIVASHKWSGNNALAQHSLIKSCLCQPSAVSWTNLGAFYLSHGETQLAHEAFSQAQNLDPSYVTCWVGQALVAESIGHYEMFDLFRHTTLLGIHLESCIGYSHHVTDLACDRIKQGQRSTEDTLKQALPPATDCTVFYTRSVEEDAIGLNMAGLTLEMMGLYESATRAYEMALSSLKQTPDDSGNVLDGVRANLGRTLTAQGKAEEAMVHFSAIKQPDYFTQCGLALASLKAGKFEEAYNGYTAALHWLAPDDSQKSHILVALASLQYKFQNSEEAKKLLFQGSQLQGASLRGLLVLAALGLVLGDAVLTNAALAELTPHQHNKEHLHNIAFLRAAEATAKGNIKEAKCILSRTIHQHPSSAPLWRALAQHLLTHLPSTKQSRGANIITVTTAAAACASAAAKLTQSAGLHKTIAQDAVTSVLATIELERAKKSKEGVSLRQAQRAVLMCPGSPEAWAMFLAAQVVSGRAQSKNICQLAHIWSQKASPGVSSWLKTLATNIENVA